MGASFSLPRPSPYYLWINKHKNIAVVEALSQKSLWKKILPEWDELFILQSRQISQRELKACPWEAGLAPRTQSRSGLRVRPASTLWSWACCLEWRRGGQVAGNTGLKTNVHVFRLLMCRPPLWAVKTGEAALSDVLDNVECFTFI